MRSQVSELILRARVNISKDGDEHIHLKLLL